MKNKNLRPIGIATTVFGGLATMAGMLTVATGIITIIFGKRK
ncbi:hypothetical protein [Lacticaseibacillus brantae]|nr:hypothetical protein [Lacticaseibacillus brantae]